jgi:PadR family transcriptional regulator, regulatory protein PadR
MGASHPNDRLQGTLTLLVLRTLKNSGALHGFSLMQRIQLASADALRVEEGSLYPALHRMTQAGWLKAEWGASESNRRARFYTITTAGRRQLEHEERSWAALTEAVGRLLQFEG